MNFKTISILFLTIGFFASCDSVRNPSKPDNLIPKSKMADVLFDLNIVTSAKGVNRKVVIDSIGSAEKYIYNKHGIDSLQFAQSSAYYSFHIKDYEVIYADVTARLTKLKTDYKAQEDTEKGTKKMADSLKRIEKDFLTKRNFKFKKEELITQKTRDTLR